MSSTKTKKWLTMENKSLKLKTAYIFVIQSHDMHCMAHVYEDSKSRPTVILGIQCSNKSLNIHYHINALHFLTECVCVSYIHVHINPAG